MIGQLKVDERTMEAMTAMTSPTILAPTCSLPSACPTSWRSFGIPRAAVARWLGSQCWALDLGPGELYMVEVWTGRARLSETVEKQLNRDAVRVGHDYGHDLDDPWQKRCLLTFLALSQPKHVWASWQCKHLSAWSRYNASRSRRARPDSCQGPA